MHVGVVVGVPIIGLFGPTEYDRTRPYTENFLAMRGPCQCNAGTLFNQKTVMKISECEQPCLEAITPEKVAAEAFRILEYSNE